MAKHSHLTTDSPHRGPSKKIYGHKPFYRSYHQDRCSHIAAHDCPYHRRTKTAHAMACNASMISWETIPFAPTSTCSLKTGALNLQNQMK